MREFVNDDGKLVIEEEGLIHSDEGMRPGAQASFSCGLKNKEKREKREKG